jgi:hypothetical protein
MIAGLVGEALGGEGKRAVKGLRRARGDKPLGQRRLITQAEGLLKPSGTPSFYHLLVANVVGRDGLAKRQSES